MWMHPLTNFKFYEEENLSEPENPEAAAEAFDRFPAQDQQEKKDIELTEGQLGKVSGGYKVNVEYKEVKR
jgi:hypothetical protein